MVLVMANTVFRKNEIIFVLGAGASVDAGIPDSDHMVREIERLVSSEDDSWREFRALYHYIRSSILFGDGVAGTFGEDVLFNVERVVNVLDELLKKERHALYPFVGSWNPKLIEVAGSDFDSVRKFRSAIVQILRRKWVMLTETESASYYGGILRFQEEYEYPLRVFSLNYDLCIEEICGRVDVERGFDGRIWDWRLFDESSEDPSRLLLYKLHGSTDWYFNDEGRLTYSDSPNTIEDDDVALIFGTSYKLQYVDPFLFLAYELRKWSLDAARLIVCIGYGFNDEHINGILQQSLRQDRNRKLVAVVGPRSGTCSDSSRAVANHLQADQGQIVAITEGARRFLEEGLSMAALEELFPPEEDLMPEV